MTTEPITRGERQRLRELAGTAHRRELSRELARLDAAFVARRGGRLSPHELGERVRRFYDGPARDPDGLYTRVDPAATVARAAALGLVATAEVPGALLAKLAPAIEFYGDPADPGAAARLSAGCHGPTRLPLGRSRWRPRRDDGTVFPVDLPR